MSIPFSSLRPVLDLTAAPKVDTFPAYLKLLQDNWKQAISAGRPIFQTQSQDLFKLWLSRLPKADRTYYNCNCCRDFINRYGGLVTISDTGLMTPILWSGTAPQPFKTAHDDLYFRVQSAKIDTVFLTIEATLGTKTAGGWQHMWLDASHIVQSGMRSVTEMAAEVRENHRTLQTALPQYTLSTISQVLELIATGTVYRPEVIKGHAVWLDRVKRLVPGVYTVAGRNLLWAEVAVAPAGYCHIKFSVLGSLLDDLQAGMSMQVAATRFNKKMNPTQYQRPQAAPTTQNVARAETLIAKLGLQPSLERRYANIEDLETIWKPQTVKTTDYNGMTNADLLKLVNNTAGRTVANSHWTKAMLIDRLNQLRGTVFAAVKTKTAPVTTQTIGQTQTMTWEKFARTVLPTPAKIEYLVPVDSRQFVAFLTAVNPKSPPILQWDNLKQRNQVSWFFYQGPKYAYQFNLQPGWVPVQAISLQPNMWHGNQDQHGKGVFLALAGAQDQIRQAGPSLFPEILRSELHEVRATVEAYCKVTKLTGSGTAAGVMFNEGPAWDLLLRVTSKTGLVQQYRIDRWD